MADFSNQPTMKGFFAPTRFESDVYDCEVLGKVPTDLNGAFVRLGGDWFYPPSSPNDSPFNVDGYISMFRFKNGIVDYKGRWVKTPRFRADLGAHRQLSFTLQKPRITHAWRQRSPPPPARWIAPARCWRANSAPRIARQCAPECTA